jgi:hypothetical protein
VCGVVAKVSGDEHRCKGQGGKPQALFHFGRLLKTFLKH